MNGMTEMTSVAQDILELEKICEQMYNANSPQQIHDANKVLENFTTTPDCLAKCQIILNRGVVSCPLHMYGKVFNTKQKNTDFRPSQRHHIRSTYRVLYLSRP
jgi:hypothetical protein